MRQMIYGVMGVILLVSLGFNVYFVCRSYKNDMSVSTSQVEQDGLIGTWHDGNEEIQIKEDGSVLWIKWDMYQNISGCRRGYIDDYNLIFTETFDKGAVEYKNVGEIGEALWESSNQSYSMVMYGEDAFGLVTIDRVTLFTFVKENKG